MAAVVELAQVTKVYGSLQALADFTLAIEDGEFISLLGPSGCGKTTVLRLIGGFERCDAGSLRIDGQDVAALPPEKRAVNTVFQNYALFPHLTVFDNVAFGLKMAGRKSQAIAGIVHQALRQVRLEGMEQRKPAMLSGGQQQRVAIARAIVNKPRVLLLDEPLSALDYRLRKEMQKELKDLHRQLGITFVLVTHDQDEAFTMSDRVVVMDHGRIEQIGSPREIYEEPVNLHVARFVGEINILDGRVLQRQGDQLTVELEGSRILVKSDRPFSDSQPVHVLLRPEDVYLKVVPAEQAEAMRGPNQLLGLVTESYYRGATYDLVVRLASGKELQVTEFFDEDAETVAYLPGQTVLVEWIGGWEVVLPHA